ncbi:hypothetical protein ACIQMR_14760 [Streptomyces sp. NPDC091376]
MTGSLAGIAIPGAETGAAFGKDNRLITLNSRTFTPSICMTGPR